MPVESSGQTFPLAVLLDVAGLPEVALPSAVTSQQSPTRLAERNIINQI
jgi:hypothetical protein